MTHTYPLVSDRFLAAAGAVAAAVLGGKGGIPTPTISFHPGDWAATCLVES